MADVRFDHVTKRYHEHATVIRDLTLEIQDQEFLVLVGPSGCGKSTALRMIAGLEEITEGDLYIGEQRVNAMPPKDRDIAMVFQNYALYPHLSVYENMAFSLKLRHLDKTEIARRIQNAAAMLGLEAYLSRKPRQLSGGQRQRVALGRALVRDPQVFLLDEPLSNLDAKLRVQTRAEISRLHQATHTTFVYVTHDQIEAMTMGDRIAVLDAGVIQQVGTPQDVYDHPANLFVAGFIGSPAMNFFNACLIRQGDATMAVAIGTGAVGSQTSTLVLSAHPSAQLAGQVSGDGRPVIVGIRPEDLHLAGENQQSTLSGTLDVVEHLGNEQLGYVRIPGALVLDGAETQSSLVRLPADVRVHSGQTLTLAVDTSKIHLFDATTTNRLA